MKTNKLKLVFIILVMIFTSIKLVAQVSTLGHSGSTGDYLGWQQGNSLNLDIVNEDQLPINFYTDGGAGSGGMWNNLRMFIQGTNGNVGIGNFTTANTLLHLHQENHDNTTVNFQMTNSIIGNAATNGFLVDVDAGGIARLNLQEASPIQFWGIDAL